ncbi:peptidylprolyl isomerase [Sorangium cellulosum]|uniref:Peptidyl-prolyl cis-trans isomerase n=1 Tax=Sorangium cellulosum TaxID=56 RepID=A0A4V0NEE4_SORCE|nr:peptidylprolyl isomerase [Sorangium cellulosum]AUX25882.1 peptidylprolyl isomerase [Sorangium cellulosum]
MANQMPPMESLPIATDTVVTLSYVLFDEHGETVDQATASEPLVYVHGYAQIVPGLERALEGLRAGEQREITVNPEDAFGEHEEAGVFEVDKADFPDASEVEVGDEFVAQGPDGEPMALRVVDVLPDGFRVDMNHPLAGQTVRFQVQVSDVRAASEDEIAQAQAELEERIEESESAGCCGHDHDHDHDHPHEHGDGGVLVKLSKKSS